MNNFSYFLFVYSPVVNIDPIHSNMNSLYVELIKDSLTEYVYPANLGGLYYDLYAKEQGIGVSYDFSIGS